MPKVVHLFLLRFCMLMRYAFIPFFPVRLMRIFKQAEISLFATCSFISLSKLVMIIFQ